MWHNMRSVRELRFRKGLYGNIQGSFSGWISGGGRARLRLIGAFAIIRGVEGNDMPVAMMMNEVQNYPDLWTEIDDNIRQCI